MRRSRAATVGVACGLGMALSGLVVGIALGYRYYTSHVGDWRVGLTAVGIGAAPVGVAVALIAAWWLARLFVRWIRRLPRLPIAIAVVAVTLAPAVYLHERTVPRLPGCYEAVCMARPPWEDPVAVLLALGGLATAAGILMIRRPIRPIEGAGSEPLSECQA